MFRLSAAGLCAVLLLSGCASEPLGPTARVLPAPGKPFEAFQQDQSLCKQFADGETAGGAMMSNVKQLGTAALSIALGAGLGAATTQHRGGQGAAPGAALGALAGAVTAARGSSRDQSGLQGRYDLAYTQCMFARGNQIPGPARGVYPGLAVARNSPGVMPGPYMPGPYMNGPYMNGPRMSGPHMAGPYASYGYPPPGGPAFGHW